MILSETNPELATKRILATSIDSFTKARLSVDERFKIKNLIKQFFVALLQFSNGLIVGLSYFPEGHWTMGMLETKLGRKVIDRTAYLMSTKLRKPTSQQGSP
jgi:hypothetical protein